MRPALTHGGMLLLGVLLTVGMYEGSRLVRNTTRALSGARVEQPAPPASVQAAAEGQLPPSAPTKPRAERKGRKGRKARRAAREAQGLEVRGPRERAAVGRPDLPAGLPNGLMLSPKGVMEGRLPNAARLSARPGVRDMLPPVEEEEGEEPLDTGLVED
ncbi:MAG: hypothetical protein KTR31_40585 [Myxococcales bacterium]|nr:hypothetical protein [Myxococcales bacterium]